MSDDRVATRRLLRAALVGVAAVLTLAACAPGSPDRDVPSPTSGGDAGTGRTPAATAPADDSAGGSAGLWRPPVGATWQYQLSGTLDLSVDAEVFDIDWEDTTAAQVKQLKDQGRAAVCYVNAGAYEEWRGDADSYPSDLLGEPLDDWPGERWLDIRDTEALLPLLAARFDVCREKGFDAVEADNVDGYSNETGFPLTAEDQIAFNTAVAGLAHDRGLSIGLKNNVEQIAELEPSFDFAVNEECLVYDECEAYAPFVQAGKAVLHVEYETPSPEACARAKRAGLSTIVKDLELESDLDAC